MWLAWMAFTAFAFLFILYLSFHLSGNRAIQRNIEKKRADERKFKEVLKKFNLQRGQNGG